MIVEIQARTLLSAVRQPDPWFGLRYNMNLYRGCQHHCIYCDSRSECYQIDQFDRDVLVKVNAPELLDRELSRKRVKGTIGTGSMNDPYMPLEAERHLTARVLEVIARHRFPVHILTKSALVMRDLAVLQEINRTFAAVSFTITCADDELAARLEPGAARVGERLQAMRALADAGICTGVTLMPVLPFITDSEDNIRAIVERAADAGASYVVASFAVTLRDRQRDYFYNHLDSLFPALRERYQRVYGERYACPPTHTARLEQVLHEVCARRGLSERMPIYQPPQLQPRLL